MPNASMHPKAVAGAPPPTWQKTPCSIGTSERQGLRIPARSVAAAETDGRIDALFNRAVARQLARQAISVMAIRRHGHRARRPCPP